MTEKVILGLKTNGLPLTTYFRYATIPLRFYPVGDVVLLSQQRVPLIEGIEKYLKEETCRLHMPGHKGGAGAGARIQGLLGQQAFQGDLTELSGLDDLHQPQGIIMEAQALAAAAYGAQHTFFLVNGASAGILASFLALVKPGDKVFLPRHVHRSVFSALVLSGAYPIYVTPTYHQTLAMPLGISHEGWQKAWEAHPDGKLALFIHPTYEGIVSVDRELVSLAKERGLRVLVDEAHGGHFPFHPILPPSSLSLGADVVIHGSHKNTGSLTQSGMLHLGSEMDPLAFQDALRLIQTTSPSYLLLASLDGARHELVSQGEERLGETIRNVMMLRDEIKGVKGIRSWYEELYTYSEVKGLDPTKIVIDALKLGLGGFELAKLLWVRHRIQIEMATDFYVLALFSLGDGEEQATKVLGALHEVAASCSQKEERLFSTCLGFPLSDLPLVVMSPRESFFARKKSISLEEAVDAICGELVVPYPPGIPLLCPGELISAQMVERLINLRKLSLTWQGLNDPSLETIRVLAF